MPEAKPGKNHRNQKKFYLTFSMRDVYINSNMDLITKLESSSKSIHILDILLDDHKHHPNQKKNNQKMYNELEHLSISLKDSK